MSRSSHSQTDLCPVRQTNNLYILALVQCGHACRHRTLRLERIHGSSSIHPTMITQNACHIPVDSKRLYSGPSLAAEHAVKYACRVHAHRGWRRLLLQCCCSTSCWALSWSCTSPRSTVCCYGRCIPLHCSPQAESPRPITNLSVMDAWQQCLGDI